MSWYEMVLARRVPEPEWYPAGLFGACISRSPKQNRFNIRLADAQADPGLLLDAQVILLVL